MLCGKCCQSTVRICGACGIALHSSKKTIFLSSLRNLTVTKILKDAKPSTASGRKNPLWRKHQFSIQKGPGLKDFLQGDLPSDAHRVAITELPYVATEHFSGHGRKVYFDVYGCQMNVNDTEIIWSVLKDVGFTKTDSLTDADVVLVVTCSIREGAETKIWNKLQYLKGINNTRMKTKEKPPMKIGILGCMAERLKFKLLEREQCVDIIAGPDSYRDLPRLLAVTDTGQAAVNVLLSLDETYADIMPVRLNQDAVTAFVSIMRGCDNMCTYCIVPFTRGRERSRPVDSILAEVRQLSEQGIKEVTLLGQNVNSYRDMSAIDHYGGIPDEETHLAKGFRTVYKNKRGGLRFADLLDKISLVNPEMRIRFTSPHPKDFPDEVLQLIHERPNICRNLHLPAQSGSTKVLERMRRGYSREAYLELVNHVRQMVPGVALSSDFICGFCGETEEEFQETLDLIKRVKYNTAFLFPYSMREKTTAHRRFDDDVPSEVKQRRLIEMVSAFRDEVYKLNQEKIGQVELVLVEGPSKRSVKNLAGRNDGNVKVIFPATEIPQSKMSSQRKQVAPGDYVAVLIEEASSQVLKGHPLYHSSLVNHLRDSRENTQRNTGMA
ncbi:CDK5RAP1-like protein [Schistocerca nitens]|uniref:CDK5RAP1-like protein n=1 Tax=Schistocerca nitens TaxID=7011 RepID=UPI0021193453|nr:CDK5RAP1-like protein [Schistocerca nitens]